MTRVKKNVVPEIINYENNKEDIKRLLYDEETNKDMRYVIVNYEWFYDYYKAIKSLSNDFIFRYNNSEETKNIIEISFYSDMGMIIKIPICKTNLTEEFVVKINYMVPYSKFNDNLLVFVFDKNTISYRYSYKTKLSIFNLKNDNYFSLYSISKDPKKNIIGGKKEYIKETSLKQRAIKNKTEQSETTQSEETSSENNFIMGDLKSIINTMSKTSIKKERQISTSSDTYNALNLESDSESDSDTELDNNDDNTIDEESIDDEYLIENVVPTIIPNLDIQTNNKIHYFSSITEEKINLNQEVTCFKNIESSCIKNVICYLSIEFDNLKDIFSKFGNSRIQVTILNNEMKFEAVSPKYDKYSIVKLFVINIDKRFQNKQISFFLNTKNISKLKSLTGNFKIVPSTDKKIFKKIEFKIVYSIQNNENIYGITIFPGNFESLSQTTVDGFDLYNSIMIYIQQDE